ncbi:hypothetical protein ACQPX6_29720 [Actinomycetospora sp. CA-101289]|uniref:hypothetical protein n=1 Tax=Actinomycetospora sp. CA-101289 TaxID=3239893 RepID=UPI003D98E090
MAGDDEPDFLRARCPLTGVRAKIVAHLVIFAERHCGGEIVPLAGLPLDEQLVLNADNVRRNIALAGARLPRSRTVTRARIAVNASIDFCVAVALSADELEARLARRRAAQN